MKEQRAIERKEGRRGGRDPWMGQMALEGAERRRGDIGPERTLDQK